MNKPNSFCHSCGKSLEQVTVISPVEKHCINCGAIHYRNSLPVAVLIAPSINNCVWVVRRGIPPFIGQIALPGGFKMADEIWQAAAARETYEEAQLVCKLHGEITEHDIDHVLTKSSDDGSRDLIVGSIEELDGIQPFEPNTEVTERVRLHPLSDEQLCFPIHRQALAMYWDAREVKHNVMV